MKRLMRLVIILALVCCLLPVGASAEDIRDSGACGDGLTWTLDKKGVLTISGTGDMYDYDMEGNKAPWQSWDLVQIVVEDGVTSIGDYAFYNQYYRLYQVELGDTVTSIGAYAFFLPDAYHTFEELTVPASVTEIETEAFGGQACHAYIFEGDMPAIAENAFRGAVSAAVYPYGNTTWNGAGFASSGGDFALIPCGGNGYTFGGECGEEDTVFWCYNGTENSLWITGKGDMHDYTFRTDSPWVEEGLDSEIREVIIDEGITSVGDWSFALCYSLADVSIPESVTYIGEYAFRACGMEYIEIPRDVTYIGECAFISCDNLATVVFAGSAPEMHPESFCKTITNAWYPAGDASWSGTSSFHYGGYLNWQSYTADTKPAPGLAEKPAVNIADTQWSFSSGTLTVSCNGPMHSAAMYEWDNFPWNQHKDEVVHLVIAEGTESISSEAFANYQNLQTVELPSSLKVIGGSAFMGCTNLTDVSMTDGLRIICEGVFQYCEGLTEVNLPDSVYYLGEFAFSGCYNLKEIHLPESLRRLQQAVLDHVGAETVTVPRNVTYVEPNVFWDAGVKNVYFTGNAPGFHEYAFDQMRLTCYYPENDPTWTDDVMQDYRGRVTWVPYDAGNSDDTVLGDLDGDGSVNDADVALLLWHTLFPESYEIFGDADFNKDGSVNDLDVAYLLWHTLFPEQYPIN